MKRKFLLTALTLIFAILCVLGIAACTPPHQDKPDDNDKQQPTKAEIEEIILYEALFLFTGEKETLNFQVYPEDAVYTSVKWETSNKEIADVDQKGTVTAISAGSAVITLTVDGKKAVCRVDVEKLPETQVDRIDLNKTTLYLSVGESETLTATLTPSAPNNTVEWETGFEEGVISVDSSGKVTAIAEGQTSVRARTLGATSWYCSVYVSSGTKGLQFSETYGDNRFARVTYFDKDFNCEEVVIPSTYKGLPVKQIDSGAFSDCEGLKKVVIPDSVTEISYRAFYNCTNLTQLTIPENIEAIDTGAFDGCEKLTGEKYGGAEYLGTKTNKYAVLLKADGDASAYEIHADTKVICSYAFAYCNLSEIEIPEGVKYIGIDAFNGTGLNSLSVPASVKYIGFNYNTSLYGLKEITVDENNEVYSSSEGVLYNKNKTEIIWIPYCKSGTLTIPEGVTNVGDIRGEYITDVFIPDSVTTIGYKYWGMKFNSVTVGENNANFQSKSGILYSKNTGKTEILFVPFKISGDVELLSGLETVTADKFSGKNITSITIPESVTSIEKGAFSNCSALQKITVPFVGGSPDARYYNTVADVDKATAHFGYIFGASLIKEIGNNDAMPNNKDFVPASLKEVVITKQIGTEYYAFYGCGNIEKVSFTNFDVSASGGYKIGRGTFYECNKLATLVLARGIEEIEAWSLTQCALTKIVLPTTCTSVRDANELKNLTVYYTGTESQWPFTTSFANATVYYSGEWEYVDGEPVEKQ